LDSLVGCYASSNRDAPGEFVLNPTGILSYGDNETPVSLYEDKQSQSLLPQRKVLADSVGGVLFATGHPMLLRIDTDGFVLPSETGPYRHYSRSACPAS
jgi:hypothetical protein